jgi:hypothetical protein
MQHAVYNGYWKCLQLLKMTKGRGRVVALLLIRLVPSSNNGPDPGYPDWGFRNFPQSFGANAGIVGYFKSRHDRILFNSLFINHPYHSTLHSLSKWKHRQINQKLRNTNYSMHFYSLSYSGTHSHVQKSKIWKNKRVFYQSVHAI